MVHRSKVLHGLAAYVDNEIVAKMAGGWKAWVVGGAAGIIVARADKFMAALAANPMAQALGVVEGENIDIDLIYAELLKQAQKSSATVELPIIGPITFSASDIESAYRYIIGG